MPLFQQNFPILSFEQANPGLMGFQAGQQIGSNALAQALAAQQLRYFGPEQQQQILSQQLANQKAQAQLPYAGEMAAAQLATEQQRPNLLAQQAALAQAQSTLPPSEIAQNYAEASLRDVLARTALGEMPAKIAQAQADIYSDPMAQRAHQLAQQLGIPDQTLLGFGGSPGLDATNPQSQIPYGNKSQQIGTVLGNNIANLPSLYPESANLPQLTPQQTNTLNTKFGAQPQQTDAKQVEALSQLQNYIKWGSPLQPWVMDELKNQYATTGKTGVVNYNDAFKTANDDAQVGKQIQYEAQLFKDNYNASRFKGPGVLGGDIPATGWKSTPFLLGSNLSAEQSADLAANNLVGYLTRALLPGQRITNNEWNSVKTMKPSRLLSPELANQQADFLQAKGVQLQERPQFLAAAQNANIDANTANTLWNLYLNQREPYDLKNNSLNKNFQNSWQDFLQPNVVSAVQNGKTPAVVPSEFTNSSQMRRWYENLPSNLQTKETRDEMKQVLMNQGGQ